MVMKKTEFVDALNLLHDRGFVKTNVGITDILDFLKEYVIFEEDIKRAVLSCKECHSKSINIMDEGITCSQYFYECNECGSDNIEEIIE